MISLHLCDKEKKLFISSVATYLIFFLTIIAAHYLYVDDRHRAFFGYFYWDIDGRFFTYYIMKMLAMNGRVFDIWPLPQFMSLVVMAATSLVMARQFSIGKNHEVIILSAPIFTNVFFLENMSYIFDSISMTLSVFFSILASLLFLSPGKRFRNIALSAFFLFLSLQVYQVSLNIFLCSVSCIAAYYSVVCGSRKSIRCFAEGMFVAVLAYVIYVISLHFLTEEGYVNDRSKILELDHLVFGAAENFKNMLVQSHEWLGYQLNILFALIFFVSFLAIIVKVVRDNRRYALGSLVTFCIFLLLGFFAMFGPLLLLEKINISARILCSLGVYISFVSVIAHVVCDSRAFKLIIKILMVMFIFVSFKTSLVYGNALSEQKYFEKHLLYSFSQQINSMHSKGGFDDLYIVGEIPYSPLVNKLIANNALIESMIPQIVSDQWFWTNRTLYTFGLQSNIEYKIENSTPRGCLEKMQAVYICNEAIYLDFNNL